MKITWKDINDENQKIVNDWLSSQDKHNLCMEQKSWSQTALDINECILHMDKSEFKNIIGYCNSEPAVAVMFGIEGGDLLNLYNIVVNPKFRHLGIGKFVINSLVEVSKNLNLKIAYKKVMSSTLPTNFDAQKLFENCGFKNLGFNGEYVVFEKDSLEK